MSPVITLAMKDLRLLAREKAALFFTLGFPIIFAVFLGTIFAGAFPFVLITTAVTILLMIVPQLSLWLLG